MRLLKAVAPTRAQHRDLRRSHRTGWCGQANGSRGRRRAQGFKRHNVPLSTVAKLTQARYGTSSHAVQRSTFAKAQIVPTIASHSATMTKIAAPIACSPKITGVHAAFSGPRGQEPPVSVYRVTAEGGREPFVEGIVKRPGIAFDPVTLTYIGSPGSVTSDAFIRTATGGRLAGIPLVLRLRAREVAPDGRKKTVHTIDIGWALNGPTSMDNTITLEPRGPKGASAFVFITPPPRPSEDGAIPTRPAGPGRNAAIVLKPN